MQFTDNISEEASDPQVAAATPIVGLVAVTGLPTDTEPTRFTWVDPDLLMVGYDPARIDRDTVAWLIGHLYGEHTLVTDGVPA